MYFCLHCGRKGVCRSKAAGTAPTTNARSNAANTAARNVTRASQSTHATNAQHICEGGEWMVLSSCVQGEPASVCLVGKTEPTKLYIDSGCTHTVLPRAYVQDYIVSERSCESTLGMAVAGSTFKVESEGVLQLPLVDARSGKPMLVMHRALLSKDSRVQPLLRGLGICLDAGGCAKKSYVDLLWKSYW
eukprot:GHVR01160544.1.p1 GENE.GHVR01160544.1~~GHVR01160544.1.p1  ORF type:complete len:189 (-),score=30.27 GHVR01160544.1:931-1497(-)